MPDPTKACFAPAGSVDPTLLLLGSLPGERSLREGQYYAHPSNQFWRLLGAAIGSGLADLPYEARLAALADRGIALWDVVATARRRGSLDGALRSVEANPLRDFVRTHPALRAIGFNGKVAARIGRKALGDVPGVTLLDLPSSSPAYTLGFDAKYEAWSALAAFASRA